MEFVASLSQGRTAAAQCGLFTYKSVPVIFEPPCIYKIQNLINLKGYVHIVLHLPHPRVFVWILIHSNTIYAETKYKD